MKMLKSIIGAVVLGCLGTLPVYAFTVTVARVGTATYGLVFSGQTDSYFQVCSADHPGGPWSVIDMGWIEQTSQVWTNLDFLSLPGSRQFYRLRQVALTNALDVDSDGMDDVYEMGWNFLNPLDGGDAQQDYDGDALYNYGEYLYNSSPENPDSDSDWAMDGYEVYMGKHPANAESTPVLEFRINNNALYTSDTNVSLVFGGLIGDYVELAGARSMEGSTTNPFGQSVAYHFESAENAWRTIYAHLLRANDSARSPLITSSIILDTEPPALTIGSPTNGFMTDRRWVRLEGNVTDTAGTPSVYVNGTIADQVTRGFFAHEKVYLTNGVNAIRVVATDQVGNSVTQHISVVQDISGDSVAPSVVLDLPEDFLVAGGVTNYLGETTVGEIDALRVAGSVDDETATVAFYAVHALGTNGPFDGTLFGTQVVGRVFLGYGTNALLAVAT
ncbi:MAG: hypothetical protein EOM20_16725, partial [Spartobacteria bacterium]|nr:hypothetical protein [Spartobacteria bacterium]